MDPQSRPTPFRECNHFPKPQCSVWRPCPTRVQEGAVGRSLETWGGLKSCLHGLHGQGHLLGLAALLLRHLWGGGGSLSMQLVF